MKTLISFARGVQIFILRQLVCGISQLAEEPSVTFRKSRRALPGSLRFERQAQDEIRANRSQITNTHPSANTGFAFDEALALQRSERGGHGVDADFKAVSPAVEVKGEPLGGDCQRVALSVVRRKCAGAWGRGRFEEAMSEHPA